MDKVKKVKDLNLTIDSNLVTAYVITGFDEEDMVGSSTANDKVAMKTDAKGEPFVVINEKTNGTLTIMLDELSDAVSVLEDHLEQNEKMEILRDMPDGSKRKYTTCYVLKEPDKDTSTGNDVYEYEIVYGKSIRV